MPQPNATIGSRHPQAVANATSAMNRQDNPEYVFIGNANMNRKVEYYVHIFNVSTVEVKIERPWVNMGGIITVPAREPGERVSKPYKIADVVQVPLRNDSNKTVQSIGQTGEFLAQDAINPDDMQGNWRTVQKMNTGKSFSEGTNLYHWGLFWTRNSTPTDEEVSTAVQRLEANYNRLIEEAKMLWAQSKPLEIGFTHRHAASHFGLEFPWNNLYTSSSRCEECQKSVPSTAALCPHCKNVLNWPLAVKRGLKTKADAIEAGVELK